MSRIVDKLKKSVSVEQDDPFNQGYQRVASGEGSASQPSNDVDDSADNKKNPFVEKSTHPKSALKESKVSVSFDEEEIDTFDDNFQAHRAHFQKFKSHSSATKRLLLNDLHQLLNNDARRQFQAKKHQSLDPKSTKQLQLLLKSKESSSSDEFENTRREFQSRKHKSLDNRHIRFALDKESSPDSEDEFNDSTSLLKVDPDITKPVIIDLNDLESSSDEENIEQKRKDFQKQKHISVESRRSIKMFEMEDMGSGSEARRVVRPLVRQITEDGRSKLEIYRPTTNPIYIYSQILAAVAVSLGSCVVGFSSAYTSPALVSMSDRNITNFEVTEQDKSWIGGLMPLAGLAGGISGGPLIELLGRRNTILATSVPFILSGLLIACAVNVGMVFAGRALSGFCVGIASLSLPVYLGEALQPEVRGTLGLLPTVFGNIGILICFVAGNFMNWSALAFLGAALPVPFLICMFIIPETPRWYVSKGRDGQARKALQWLRGKKANVEVELKGIVKSHADAEKMAGSNQLMELMKRNNLKPLFISLGLMLFQQMSGINAVIFYTTSIFKQAGSTINENLCTIIVGVVNFISVFFATVLIDRLGRKILLYISDCAMIVTLIALGSFFYMKEHNMEVSHLGWLPLASFVIFVIGFSLGFGPIPWLMMGEILPARVRGTAASVATGFNWACTFVVTKTFVDMTTTIGTSGAFWLFGAFCVASLFFVIFCVPETQGKTLEDIERKMMGPVRRMSSVANMKPLSFNM